MHDYTATPTNPTTLSCHVMNQEASSPIPNNSLADDLITIFTPTNPDTIEFDHYSLHRSDTHIKITVKSKPIAEIPLAYVPLIINDLRGSDTDFFSPEDV